jgi:hypothetical protein
MSYGNPEALPYMYRVIEFMAQMRYPIVFKGAMVLRTLLANKGFTTSRMTEDVDGDWVNSDITNEALLYYVKLAVDSLNVPNLYVEQHRRFDATKSAGFHMKFVGNTDPFFSMDIGVKGNNFYTSYSTINGVEFYGSTTAKIITDKIIAVSSKVVRRRTKDIYDLFLLSGFEGVTIHDIDSIIPTCKNQLGDFDIFRNGVEGKNGLRYGYDKLEGVFNKPNFDIVYKAATSICRPFISGEYGVKDGVWMIDRSTGIGNWFDRTGTIY